MALVTRHITVRGRVQGVGYRYSAYYAALRYGVDGWVRNRRDGSVEIMAQGAAGDVEAFIAWARQGPSMAHVDSVDVSDGAGTFDDFRISDTL
jgi:acylphosphatase